ncbi:MAG: hypothetical protein AB1758_15800, partial [Candidatus Eremiobacterota bacterium]
MVTALLLELTAFELAGLGSTSAAPAIFLLAACGLGARVAAVFVVACVGARQLLRGDGFPGLALHLLAPLACLTLAGTQPYVAAAVYALISLVVGAASEQPAPIRIRWWLWQAGLVLLGASSAGVAVANPWLAFWVLPVS